MLRTKQGLDLIRYLKSYQNGYGTGDQCGATVTADTEEEALQWAKDYLERWNPLGYGTTVGKPHLTKEGRWQISGQHFASCD